MNIDALLNKAKILGLFSSSKYGECCCINNTVLFKVSDKVDTINKSFIESMPLILIDTLILIEGENVEDISISDVSSINTLDISRLTTNKTLYVSVSNINIITGDKVINNLQLYNNKERVIDLNKFKFSENGVDFSYAFCDSLATEIIFPDNIVIKDMKSAFSNCAHLKQVDLSKCRFKGSVSLQDAFNECSSLTKVIFSRINVSSLSRAFYLCKKLKYLNINYFNTTYCYALDGCFGYCTNIKQLDLSTLDFKNVTNLAEFAAYSGIERIKLPKLSNSIACDYSNMLLRANNCKTITFEKDTYYLKNVEKQTQSIFKGTLINKNIKENFLSQFLPVEDT